MYVPQDNAAGSNLCTFWREKISLRMGSSKTSKTWKNETLVPLTNSRLDPAVEFQTYITPNSLNDIYKREVILIMRLTSK